jgi:hypothetical protein
MPAAHATSPVQHLSMSFDEDPVVSTVAGLSPDCPDLAGTLTETRHLDIRGWVKPDGSAHAVTTATATVTLVPSDSSRPSYTGGYVTRESGQYTGSGEDERIDTATTHGYLDGTDGSSYEISEVGHLTIGGTGEPRVWFDRLRCEPAH